MDSRDSVPLDNDDDDPVVLSPEALQALHEFYKEQEEPSDDSTSKLCNNVQEDWQLSQFWYDEKTSTILAEIAVKAIEKKGSIVCLSCPTLFFKLQELLDHDESLSQCEIFLLEYDNRFSSAGDKFVHYDYREPLKEVCERFAANSIDLVVADPPFLSEECMEKTSQTINYLKKNKLIVCTGAKMSAFVQEHLLLREHPTFQPQHSRNLGNEFKCFLNFEV